MNNKSYFNKSNFEEFMIGPFTPEEVEIFVDMLDAMGFFTAPASTKYHGDYEGGLFDHSYEVAKALVDLTEKNNLAWQDPRSPYLVGMFHDICKCDSYIMTKSDDGTLKIEYNKSQALTGHGDKSVIIAQKLIAGIGSYLTDEEILAIRWHMGAFDEKENWGAYGKSCEDYPNVLWTHHADMIASKVVGV